MLDSGAVPKRRLVTRVTDHIRADTITDGKNKRQLIARTDDRMRDVGWAAPVSERSG
ncbi:MAG: hypothetical protein M3292_04715 [Actinomycetota bacterium]|nr:hypothetical protein [Actinomycetota bacterium]